MWSASICPNCGHALEKRTDPLAEVFVGGGIGAGLLVLYFFPIVFSVMQNPYHPSKHVLVISTVLYLIAVLIIGFRLNRQSRLVFILTTLIPLGLITACVGGANFGMGS